MADERVARLQDPFGAGDRVGSGIVFGRHPDRAGGRLEDAFGDVVGVASVVKDDVEVALRVGGERLPEVFDEFAVEGPDFWGGYRGVILERVAAAEIDGGGDEALVHRKGEVAVAADAGAVAEGLVHGLAEGDPDIFGGVVIIDVQVTRRGDGEVDECVFRQQVEHVVEEADPRGSLPRTASVEVEGELDVGFAGLPIDLCGAVHGAFRGRGPRMRRGRAGPSHDGKR